MKNILFFTGIVFCYAVLIFLDKSYIVTDSKVFDYLAKDYPSVIVQNYIETQEKWWWVSYAIMPIVISIKILLVAFCLNFIKLFEIEG